MTKYRVIMTTGASTVIDVEAESEDEAENAAFNEVPYICAQCSGFGREAGIELGDWETEVVEKVE